MQQRERHPPPARADGSLQWRPRHGPVVHIHLLGRRCHPFHLFQRRLGASSRRPRPGGSAERPQHKGLLPGTHGRLLHAGGGRVRVRRRHEQQGRVPRGSLRSRFRIGGHELRRKQPRERVRLGYRRRLGSRGDGVRREDVDALHRRRPQRRGQLRHHQVRQTQPLLPPPLHRSGFRRAGGRGESVLRGGGHCRVKHQLLLPDDDEPSPGVSGGQRAVQRGPRR
mmetsp:Transcript_25547/g.48335  ORF Transcript_25547/g.48335 Transcript_25547/m.48335 type:complete len:224 (-) Transcript_25547:3032-3703(-)